MSAAITAIAISTAATIYQAEQTRQAQSDADERIKQEKIQAGIEKDWQNKKKGIADRNAANAALRLRGTSTDTMNAVSGTATQTPIPGTVGVLGGIGGQVTLPNGVQPMRPSSALGL